MTRKPKLSKKDALGEMKEQLMQQKALVWGLQKARDTAVEEILSWKEKTRESKGRCSLRTYIDAYMHFTNIQAYAHTCIRPSLCCCPCKATVTYCTEKQWKEVEALKKELGELLGVTDSVCTILEEARNILVPVDGSDAQRNTEAVSQVVPKVCALAFHIMAEARKVREERRVGVTTCNRKCCNRVSLGPRHGRSARCIGVRRSIGL
jgi:hypothetical protein